VRSELPDEAWLRSIAAFGALNARSPAMGRTTDGGPEVVAIILLQQRSGRTEKGWLGASVATGPSDNKGV
jgi:hypothetical protein